MAYKKILVPLDGSVTSEQVLNAVAEIARNFGAELVLMAATLDGTSDDRAGSEAAKYLESQAEKLAETGLSVEWVTAIGLPADAILETAQNEDVDLIAMATHRESAIARGILGSVADNVLRNATLPVLVINPDSKGQAESPAGEVNCIVVPLDGSDLAEESVPIAIEMAKACDAEIIFVQAVHMPSYAVSGPGGEFYGSSYGVSDTREQAHTYLSQFAERAKSFGVEARAHAAAGNAAARIVEDSNEIPGSLIVINSHGRGGFRRMVLGSVADKVIRGSHRPVLVLKQQK